MSYNNANVDDMTRPRPDLPDPNFTETAGTRAWEPHPWGGVPGIFTQLADQAGVEFDVVAVDAQRRLVARPLPQHRQRRLGPARQHRQAEVGHRGTAGAERRRAADGTRSECQHPAVQRVRGQDREVHPHRRRRELSRARDVHGDLRQRRQLRRGRRNARPRATTTRCAPSQPTRTRTRSPRST